MKSLFETRFSLCDVCDGILQGAVVNWRGADMIYFLV